MITSKEAWQKFGFESKEIESKFLTLWDVPKELEVGVIPKKIYCNKAIIEPLTKSFTQLIKTGCVNELKTWDGCYNPRPIRGYEHQFENAILTKSYELAAKYTSMHWWAIAFDVNAAWNRLRQTPTLSKEFVKCFTDNGFDWGGNFTFTRLDGMHFQLSHF